jgi:hypothetical protein
MGFLDNSGDIILDAVLTDTGRLRLARGDGSFRIAKFALGDDEIDYGKYDANNPSGSAYYDLDILKTPVFEAFTNNASNMQSKLISISRTNLLYLPVVKKNTREDNTQMYSDSNVSDLFLITVDDDTTTAIQNASLSTGILFGNGTENGNHVRLDQGLDNSSEGPSAASTIDADLKETQYIVEMDNRFGSLLSKTDEQADISFVDDDSIASYFLSQGVVSVNFIDNMSTNDANGNNVANSSLAGPRGTKLTVKVKASIDVSSTTFLFDRLGSTMTLPTGTGGSDETYLTIDTVLKVTGATTGYKIDVPIRYIKKQ